MIEHLDLGYLRLSTDGTNVLVVQIYSESSILRTT